jgi:general secretion pathway protein J
MDATATGQRGFTLLELLVAMVLLSLLTLAIGGGLRFGVRAWEASGRRSSHVLDVQTVQDAIRRQLGQALPLVLPEATLGQVRVAFDGRPNRVRFVAPIPVEVGGGLHTFTIGRLDGTPDGVLLMAWHPFNPDSDFDREHAGEQIELLSGVSAISISYFGANEPGAAAAWHDRWRNAASLPGLVRVSVTPEDEQEVWPDLLVTLRISAPPILAVPIGGGES